jgi:hypothetical protein
MLIEECWDKRFTVRLVFCWGIDREKGSSHEEPKVIQASGREVPDAAKLGS